MSINPLSFPEEEHPAAQAAGYFPYGAIGDPQAGQDIDQNANRMKQLENMLQEVQGRAEIIEKEAYDKAYLAGEKAGMVLGKKRGEQILESLQETLKEAEHHVAAMQQAFAESAMDIASFIAGQIVTEALQTDTAHLFEIANKAAAQLPDTSDLRIAVSPDDFFTFKRLLDDAPGVAVLSSDSNIGSGTCRVISSQQDILIDPVAAVSAYIEALRSELIQPTTARQPVQRDEA